MSDDFDDDDYAEDYEADPHDGWLCPICGSRITSATVSEPTLAKLHPCGHKIPTDHPIIAIEHRVSCEDDDEKRGLEDCCQ